jgi:hypothetical protein
MARTLKVYNVFIASPGGLPDERSAFYKTLNAFNESEGYDLGIIFRPIGWELTLGGMGRPQELINNDLVQCDYMLLLLHDRWGSNTGNYSSGTEEEYNVALKSFQDKNSPLKDIFIFFKDVSKAQLSDPGQQLEKVIQFRKRIEKEGKQLYRTYKDVNSFTSSLHRLLYSWAKKIIETENEFDSSKKDVDNSYEDIQITNIIKSSQKDKEESIFEKINKPLIFISYAHKDNEKKNVEDKWLDKLMEHISPLALDESVNIWSDEKIESGKNWHQEIQHALESAKVAVLLISPAFLGSKYIRTNEIPVILKNASKNGVIILPIIIRPCLFNEMTFLYPDPKSGPERIKLSDFQSVNSPDRALNGLTENEQDLILLSVAQRIYKTVNE